MTDPAASENGRPFASHDRHLTDAYARGLHAEHMASMCPECGCCWCCDSDCCAECICPNMDCGCSDKPVVRARGDDLTDAYERGLAAGRALASTPAAGGRMKTTYFGKRWDAPAFDDATEVPVPLGAVDQLCNELVDEGDSGTIMNGIGPVHLECWLRMGLGSPAHIEGRCSCSGLQEPEDDRSFREQGREVIRLIGREGWLA